MQDRLPQSRSDAVLQARTGHLSVLRELLPYVWPANRPDLRWRVVIALAALVVAKAITLAVPIAYKAVVDLLTGEASAERDRRAFRRSDLPPSRPCSSSPMASAAC